MKYMFQRCSNLTTLDISGWDTGKVTDAHDFLLDCSKLTTWKVNSKLTVTVNSPNVTVNFGKTSYTYTSGATSASKSTSGNVTTITFVR